MKATAIGIICLVLTAATDFPPGFEPRFINEKELKMPVPLLHDRPDTLDMLFIGDVMMHSAQLDAAKTDGGYDFSGYFDNIDNLINEADIAVANMEFTVGTRPYTGYPCFSAPYEILEEAAGHGIDIMLSANNHIADKGAKGFAATIGAYRKIHDEYGTVNTGMYADSAAQDREYPLIVEKNGFKVALLNFTYGTNGIPVPCPYKVNGTDTVELKRAIAKAVSDSADIIIALPHWGTEYRLMPDRAQKSLAEWLARNGVDAVIGTHPHVPQGKETINGCQIVYSLGNYISNMSLANTQAGFAATVRIVKRYGKEAKVLPIQLEYLWCSRAGHKESGFTTVVVKNEEGRRDEWARPQDYDNMLSTCRRIERTIKINE